ncbi:type II toxin-antitoxin system RelE/ParE family toxin [Lacibacter sp. MH-610]|uniref:type II toxin-antitoxin system RelE/ParE family toxin n=1 Tax=Lacibacter sp. MH-610 TaxID=3020883 RepID=UPI003891B6F2
MKKFRFIYSPLALQDIEEAKGYYENLQNGLGKKFVSQLQSSLNAIKRNPYFSSVRYDDIRCAQIKRFPYLIHYQINENEFTVTIVAVYSTHREPFE